VCVSWLELQAGRNTRPAIVPDMPAFWNCDEISRQEARSGVSLRYRCSEGVFLLENGVSCHARLSAQRIQQRGCSVVVWARGCDVADFAVAVRVVFSVQVSWEAGLFYLVSRNSVRDCCLPGHVGCCARTQGAWFVVSCFQPAACRGQSCRFDSNHSPHSSSWWGSNDSHGHDHRVRTAGVIC
jgi:hypothetical protein